MFQTIQQPFISNSTEVKRRRRSKLLSKADFSNIIIKKMRKLLIGILGQKISGSKPGHPLIYHRLVVCKGQVG